MTSDLGWYVWFAEIPTLHVTEKGRCVLYVATINFHNKCHSVTCTQHGGKAFWEEADGDGGSCAYIGGGSTEGKEISKCKVGICTGTSGFAV